MVRQPVWKYTEKDLNHTQYPSFRFRFEFLFRSSLGIGSRNVSFWRLVATIRKRRRHCGIPVVSPGCIVALQDRETAFYYSMSVSAAMELNPEWQHGSV
jgi:hypothetical protein